jgi:DNA polymerase III alpha subunit (gram-positive type)
LRIVFFDTETSNLPERNPNAEIIAYTTRVWVDGNVGEPRTIHTFPYGEVHPEAAKINGYTPEEWTRRGAVRQFDWHDVTNLREALGNDAIIGGHNTGFDTDMVCRMFARANLSPPKWNYRKVDTQAMAQALVAIGAIKSASLVNVANYIGCDISGAHTSEGDVNMTIAVWEWFVGHALTSVGR